MATIENGILGGFRGKVGGVIGYQCRGRWVMRCMPAKVHDPRTPAQLEHRRRFGMVVGLARALREAARVGMAAAARRDGMSEFDVCVRECWRAGCVAAGMEGVDYGRVRLSMGCGMGVRAMGVERVSERRLEVRWVAEEREGDDWVCVAAYDEALGEGAFVERCGRRRDGCGMMSVPRRWLGDVVRVFVFTCSVEDGEVSETVFAGEVV